MLGKTLYIKSIPFTIVGVAAKGFEGTEGKLPLDLWIPLQSRPEFNAWGNPAEDGMYLTEQKFWCMKLMVRTAPGVSREQALAQAQGVFERAAYTGIAQKRAGDPTYQLSFNEAKRFDGMDSSFARADSDDDGRPGSADRDEQCRDVADGTQCEPPERVQRTIRTRRRA